MFSSCGACVGNNTVNTLGEDFFVRRVLESPNKSLTRGVDCVTELLDHSFFDVLLVVLVWVTQLSTPLRRLLRPVLELPVEFPHGCCLRHRAAGPQLL